MRSMLADQGIHKFECLVILDDLVISSNHPETLLGITSGY